MYIEKPMNYRVKDHTCYYFDDIIRIEDFDIKNILIDEKPFENILVYISWTKSLIDSKSLRIRLNKIDGFTRVYDGTRYLVLFGSEKYDYIYNRIRCLVSVESGITVKISHYYAKIRFIQL